MLDRFQRFFNDRIAAAPGAAGDEAARLRVATCALLLEAAHADSEFSEEERGTVAELVGRRFDLDASDTAELLALAESERRAADGLYPFARLINEEYPRARKLAVVELLWRVVYSDGVLEAHEDALMHRIGKLLGLRHEELIAIKLQVKKSLAE
jgi:uncharacterized tellurite resistance protein B-like protein